MAVGWLTALKVIPWADVIEAAPGLAKSAKGFFKRTQEGATPAPESAPMPPGTAAEGLSLAQATQRNTVLEARLAQTPERQPAPAALPESPPTPHAPLF